MNAAKGEIATSTQWDLPHFLWFPAAELYGIQRIEDLDDLLILSGAVVGGPASTALATCEVQEVDGAGLGRGPPRKVRSPEFRSSLRSAAARASLPGPRWSTRGRLERLEQAAEHRHAVLEEGVVVGVGAPETFDELVHDRRLRVAVTSVLQVDVVDNLAEARDRGVIDAKSTHEYFERATAAIVSEFNAEHIEGDVTRRR